MEPEDRKGWIQTLAAFPSRLHEAVASLDGTQLGTTYRPGGWTLRQVVHHCADSHMNSFIRFKLALTEDEPTIKPYREELWAELNDSRQFPIGSSLAILEHVHLRWVAVLNSMSVTHWERGFIHPEKGRRLTLHEALALYAWHCDHHLAHVTGTLLRHGWAKQ